MVHSISEGRGMYSALQRLTDDMKEMRLEMKRMSKENKHQRSTSWAQEWRASSVGCQCAYREQAASHFGSPDRRYPEPRTESRPRDRSSARGHYDDHASSPNWHSPRPSRSRFYDDPPRRRGVRFVSPRREDASNQ